MGATLLIGLLVFGPIVLICISSLRNNSKCDKRVEATIIGHEYEASDPDGPPSHYRARFEYQYSGKLYNGYIDKQKPENGTGYMRNKETVEELYPIGTTVSVYIDPAAPYRHAMTPGGDNNGAWGCTLIVFLAAIVFFALVGAGAFR